MVISNGMLEMDIEDLLITDKQKNKYKIRYAKNNKCVISDIKNKIIKVTTWDEIKRVCSNTIENTRDMDVKRQLEEMYIIKEEHFIKESGIVTLSNTPLEDSNIYIEFDDCDKILQIKYDKEKEVMFMPNEYENYKKPVYCTYKIKDWVDVVEIKADDCNGISLEDIRGEDAEGWCVTY
ncbi:hypothetical protein [Clostridium rectalis]|uniref:hypothetical protein n=1 Tax=Clostridium rectalis TaxID=2040295 RepID=UPI000F6390CF|nr:hypothetical protein [Clostridium rectalis]